MISQITVYYTVFPISACCNLMLMINCDYEIQVFNTL